MKYENILSAIGNTPHLRLNNLFPEHEVWIKLEKLNATGSIKDRVALAMVNDAEKSGKLQKGGTIIEPTSGNTGIGLALVAAMKGYRIIITMPESMSIERRKLMSAYGAELVLTPKEQGMKGAIAKAEELVKEIDGGWIPQQFDNPSNPTIHRATTALEIVSDFPQGFDYFVSGIGTGGHITGIGEVLKAEYPQLKVIGVEPSDSPILTEGKSGAHALQGIGAGFIPVNLNEQLLDKVETITKEEAYEYTRLLAQKEGVFAGISTGASIAAVAKLLADKPKGTKVITINYDGGEKYLSVEGLF